MEIFRQSIDFLELRISQNSEGMRLVAGTVENSELKFLEHGFKIVFNRYILQGEKKLGKLCYIRDVNNVDILDVMFLISESDNKIVRNKITFYGKFWNLYSSYFGYFLDLFSVNLDSFDIIARIDYAIDIKNISVNTFHSFLAISPKEVSSREVYGRRTYFRIDTGRNKVVFYDKKLDVLDGKYYLLQDENGQFPYKKYMDSIYPVTRFEYRRLADSFRGNGRCSLRYALDNISAWAILSFKKYTGFELEYISRTYNKKVDDLPFQLSFSKKKTLYASRMASYANSLRQLSGNDVLYSEIYKLLGDDFIGWLASQNNSISSEIVKNGLLLSQEKNALYRALKDKNKK